MPVWFEEYLKNLSAREKAELGGWLLTNPDDNELITAIVEAID